MFFSPLYKFAVRVAGRYQRVRSKNLMARFAKCGENSFVQYPCIIGHPELIEIGSGTEILQNARLQCYPELGGGRKCGIHIGDHCYIGFHATMLASGATITIGNNVLIASDVAMVTYNHGIDPEIEVPYMDQPLQQWADISVGDGTWIGEKAIILPGVHIGRKCVVGGGTVVTKDVPDYCIVVGNPAKIIKQYDFESHRWIKKESS